MYLFTTNRSKILDRTGTTEMGLKSPGPISDLVLATGRMRATRHCSGIVEELNDRFKRRAIQPEHIGARRHRNQAGNKHLDRWLTWIVQSTVSKVELVP